MNRRFITLWLFTILYAGTFASAYPVMQSGAKEQQKQPKTQEKNSATSLTGCIDEQDSHYVLTDDRTLMPIATLEADGFPTEGFAKHMGHKVTIRGTSSQATPLPVFKVRTIETISETCAPQR